MTIYVYQHKVTKLLTLSETACAGELWELIDEYDVPDPGEGGGGEGTTNYNQLTNKPQVNGVTLSGNKTSLELKIKVGDVDTLTTASKETAVAAINEHDAEIGKLSDLTTAAKGNLVAAANELDKEIGDVSTLKTAAKTSVAAGLNELHDNVLEKDNTVSFTPTTDYHPATKKYSDDIDKLIEGNLATVESTTKASKAYDAGDYLVYNHKLYCVKTAIAANGTITVTGANANVTAKRVDEVIAELNAKNTAMEAEIAALATTGGVKNIVPNEGRDTFTQAGITFTKNADGSVTANGTATGTAIYRMKENLTLPKGKYVISGSPSGAADDKFFIQLHKQGVVTHRDTNNPIYPQEWDETGETVYDWYGVAFLNGTVADNMTFYPMIRPAAITDDTYVPYAMSNTELTKIAGTIVDDKNMSGRIDGASKTYNGITYTLNDDGSLTANGTATNHAYYYTNTNFKFRAGRTYRISSGLAANTSGTSMQIIVNGAAVADTLNLGYSTYTPTADTTGTVCVVIRKGNTVSNLKIYPMMQDARIADTSYTPPVMSNAEITAKLSDTGWQTPISGDDTLKYRKKNGIVQIVFDGWTPSAAIQTNASTDVYTLPSGFRPANNTFQLLVVGSWKPSVICAMRTDGKVQVRSAESAAVNAQALYGSLEFMAA